MYTFISLCTYICAGLGLTYIHTHIYTHTHRKIYRFRLYVYVLAFPSSPPFLVPAIYTGISSIRDIGLQRRLRTHSVGRPAGVGPHLHSLGSRPQQSACFPGVSVCSCLTATHCNTQRPHLYCVGSHPNKLLTFQVCCSVCPTGVLQCMPNGCVAV